MELENIEKNQTITDWLKFIDEYFAHRCPYKLNGEEKRELKQDIVIKLIEKYEKIKFAKSQKWYIHTICRNTVIDFIKSQARRGKILQYHQDL